MSGIELGFILAFFGVPAFAGGWLARSRGRNLLLWGLLSAVFPFCIFILWFQKPDKDVPGYFKKCKSCGETYPWKLAACKYCGFRDSE